MTPDDIIRMAQEAGYIGSYADNGRGEQRFDFSKEQLIEFAKLVAAAEREACAWIADTYGGPEEPMMVGTYEAGWHNAAEAIAADIRARGEA